MNYKDSKWHTIPLQHDDEAGYISIHSAIRLGTTDDDRTGAQTASHSRLYEDDEPICRAMRYMKQSCRSELTVLMKEHDSKTYDLMLAAWLRCLARKQIGTLLRKSGRHLKLHLRTVHIRTALMLRRMKHRLARS